MSDDFDRTLRDAEALDLARLRAQRGAGPRDGAWVGMWIGLERTLLHPRGSATATRTERARLVLILLRAHEAHVARKKAKA